MYGNLSDSKTPFVIVFSRNVEGTVLCFSKTAATYKFDISISPSERSLVDKFRSASNGNHDTKSRPALLNLSFKARHA